MFSNSIKSLLTLFGRFLGSYDPQSFSSFGTLGKIWPLSRHGYSFIMKIPDQLKSKWVLPYQGCPGTGSSGAHVLVWSMGWSRRAMWSGTPVMGSTPQRRVRWRTAAASSRMSANACPCSRRKRQRRTPWSFSGLESHITALSPRGSAECMSISSR